MQNRFSLCAPVFAIATMSLLFVSSARAHVTLLLPNGGEQLVEGSVFVVTWQIDIQHDTQNWDLAYSTTGPNGPWIPIAEDLPPGDITQGAVHMFEWTIPSTLSNQCRVRVCQDNAGTNYYDHSDADFSIVAPPVEVVTVDSITVILGDHVSGDLSDIDQSDDDRICYSSGQPASVTAPSLIVELDGTLPTDQPSALKVILESQVSSNDIRQRILLFNFDSGQYELIDTRGATLNTDAVAQVDLQGDLSRFVEMGTGAVRARIDYTQGPAAFSFNWNACLDQFVWELVQ